MGVWLELFFPRMIMMIRGESVVFYMTRERQTYTSSVISPKPSKSAHENRRNVPIWYAVVKWSLPFAIWNIYKNIKPWYLTKTRWFEMSYYSFPSMLQYWLWIASCSILLILIELCFTQTLIFDDDTMAWDELTFPSTFRYDLDIKHNANESIPATRHSLSCTLQTKEKEIKTQTSTLVV